MASIKAKFRRSTVDGREGTIYYQIIHERKIRQIISDCRLLPSEWDENRSMAKLPAVGTRVGIVMSIRDNIKCDVERLTMIIRKFERDMTGFSADDIVEEYKRYINEYTLFGYMSRIIARLKLSGHIRTSETYASALASFKKFRNGEDIMLDSITPEIIEAYESWHRGRGNVPNTSSFYLRILRAVYNRAVDNDIIENRNPFRRVYTGVDRTCKRALSLATIKEIKNLDLHDKPLLDYARDIFVLSFMLRGMAFVDMTFLKKSDLKYGYVCYCRRKTGRPLTIKWTDAMQAILDKYPENTSDYLLPIIRESVADERAAYHNIGCVINNNLKKLGVMIGAGIPLTLYVARHSWASAAKAKGIPVGVISEGMGHSSETITQIYLASLDTSVVDRANSLILAAL